MTPVSDIDLYSDAVLSHPYPSFQQMRDAGAAVHPDRVNACFIGRFEDFNRALTDWLLQVREFDSVGDFAHDLPIRIVPS